MNENNESASRAMLPVTDSLRAAILDALNVAESSLDYRPEFRRAMSNLHRVTNEILSSASPVAGWVSVEERLPESNVGVLIAAGGTVTAAERCSVGGHSYWSGHGFGGYEWEFHFSDSEITHWMPLPPTPPAPVTPKQEQS